MLMNIEFVKTVKKNKWMKDPVIGREKVKSLEL